MQAIRFAAALTLAAAVAAPALAQAPTAAPAPAAAPAAPVTLVAKGGTIETLQASGQFTILLKALNLTQLTAVIQGQPALTLFAPTDAAFRALPPGELDRLMKSPAAMQGVLTYHLINAPVDETKIAGAKGPVTTVAGSGLVLDGSTAGAPKANQANILVSAVKTTNGYVYVVDQVLNPAGAAAAMAEPAPVEEAPASSAN